MQSQTKREDLGTMSPKSWQPPTPHRDSRQSREAEKVVHAYPVSTTHTTKPSQRQSFKAAIRNSYSNCSEEHIPLNGLAHDASNNHLCRNLLNLCRQSLGGSSLSCGLAVSQQWHFLCGQNQGCHTPFAAFACFSQGKEGADLCQELVSPPSSPLDTFVALEEAAKKHMWAHSLDVSQCLQDWGSNNARRMADSFMPAESNAL